jgi:hypothetical protein
MLKSVMADCSLVNEKFEVQTWTKTGDENHRPVPRESICSERRRKKRKEEEKKEHTQK